MEYDNKGNSEIDQVGSIDVTKKTCAINYNLQQDSSVCYYIDRFSVDRVFSY
jgi:hypothetical protein